MRKETAFSAEVSNNRLGTVAAKYTLNIGLDLEARWSTEFNPRLGRLKRRDEDPL